MTEATIEACVKALFQGIKSGEDGTIHAASATLLSNFLINQQRIADSLSALAECTHKRGTLGDPIRWFNT